MKGFTVTVFFISDKLVQKYWFQLDDFYTLSKDNERNFNRAIIFADYRIYDNYVKLITRLNHSIYNWYDK